jgi:hypothetical protein
MPPKKASEQNSYKISNLLICYEDGIKQIEQMKDLVLLWRESIQKITLLVAEPEDLPSDDPVKIALEDCQSQDVPDMSIEITNKQPVQTDHKLVNAPKGFSIVRISKKEKSDGVETTMSSEERSVLKRTKLESLALKGGYLLRSSVSSSSYQEKYCPTSRPYSGELQKK